MKTPYRYPAVLAAVAVLILGAGMMLKPQRRPVEPVLSETETVRLERLAQRKRLQDMTSYFASVAAGAAPAVVRVKETGASGVLWDASGSVVTAPPAGADFPGPPLAAVGAPNRPGFPPAVKAAPETLEPGAWVVYLALSGAGKPLFVPAVFSGVVEARCGDFAYREVETTVSPGSAMRGGGIFDTEGRLVAVVGGCGERLTAVSVDSIDAALALAASPAQRVLARYGLRFHDALAGGVIVAEVRHGGAATEAGLIPGDRVAALDGEPVESVEQAEQRLAQPGPARLDLLRGRRKLAVTLQKQSSGIVFEPPSAGVLIRNIAGDSAATRAGLRPGDRLLLADGKPVTTLAAARRALAGEPVYLVVRRGARDLGLFLR